jgi:hypothetical protein
MKRIKIKIVQVDNKEFQKCKSGKEFKLKFITLAKPKPPIELVPPTEPVGPDGENGQGGDGSGGHGDPGDRNKPPKPKSTRDLLLEFMIETRAGFKSINTRLDEHAEILKHHGEILKRHDEIFKRNNLH